MRVTSQKPWESKTRQKAKQPYRYEAKTSSRQRLQSLGGDSAASSGIASVWAIRGEEKPGLPGSRATGRPAGNGCVHRRTAPPRWPPTPLPWVPPLPRPLGTFFNWRAPQGVITAGDLTSRAPFPSPPSHSQEMESFMCAGSTRHSH